MKYNNNQQRKSKLASAGSFAFWTLALGVFTECLAVNVKLGKHLMKSIVKDTEDVIDWSEDEFIES
jgi:hypothetical protein